MAVANLLLTCLCITWQKSSVTVIWKYLSLTVFAWSLSAIPLRVSSKFKTRQIHEFMIKEHCIMVHRKVMLVGTDVVLSLKMVDGMK